MRSYDVVLTEVNVETGLFSYFSQNMLICIVSWDYVTNYAIAFLLNESQIRI